jgi:hypothetical protein
VIVAAREVKAPLPAARLRKGEEVVAPKASRPWVSVASALVKPSLSRSFQVAPARSS